LKNKWKKRKKKQVELLQIRRKITWSGNVVLVVSSLVCFYLCFSHEPTFDVTSQADKNTHMTVTMTTIPTKVQQYKKNNIVRSQQIRFTLLGSSLTFSSWN